ncbi:Proteasome component ECM29 [Ceratocystis fimbriata CBS 114723]|uniref:Proteasome component ECM29 n=1 Tax=Ceratocystis fimbriata CBS 114723 TaxID=1035309 RepID=A0A2C5WTV4_9PEZI|nr:Proteasome component ECM29 [Ceratocystis fimbriata CBS 114723]
MTDLKTRRTVRKYLSLLENNAATCTLLYRALIGAFHDAISTVLERLEPTAFWPLLHSPRKEVRSLAAQAYGIMLAHPATSESDFLSEVASGVWLFSFVQYCSHVTEVHQRLHEAQASFMRLLSACDDMVQETASCGLTLVYEKGDEALRT